MNQVQNNLMQDERNLIKGMITPELIKAVEKVYPALTASEVSEKTHERLMFRAGQISVVDFLKALEAEKEEDNYAETGYS